MGHTRASFSSITPRQIRVIGVPLDLGQSRLRMVHGMDEAVGLETVSSMAARYGALAAVNSGYFRTTGTYRGDSVGVAVLAGKLWSEPNNVRAAVGLIEKAGRQEDRAGKTGFQARSLSETMPKSTRKIEVVLQMLRTTAIYSVAWADNLSLLLKAY